MALLLIFCRKVFLTKNPDTALLLQYKVRIIVFLKYSIAWMLNRGYVAVGTNDGVLRVMLLNLDQGF